MYVRDWFLLGGAAAIVIFVIYRAIRDKAESDALTSPFDGTSKQIIERVVAELASRKEHSFCTFDLATDRSIWFQVNGTALAQSAFAWIEPGNPVPKLLALGIPIPEGMEIVENEMFDRQVVVFNCEPLSPAEWADLIDATFKRAHGAADDYGLRGWVTRA